ncbi:MAG: hypothetical protein ABW275_06080 [Hansschlegelia sp.]
MKTILALVVAASALGFAGAAQATERHEAHRHAASAGQHHPAAKRHVASKRCDCESRRRTVERDDRYRDAAPIRGPFHIEENDGRAAPTANNDYWFQESIYDFQEGKRANLREYRY